VSGVALRDYQEEAIQKFMEAAQRGVTRQLGVAATGLGKTIIFSALAMRLNKRTLVLAHRDELISQAVDKLRVVWPEADIGVVKAERNETDHQIVVASVQTLRKPRLAKMDPDMFRGGVVITDEAHHANAVSYIQIYDHFGCGTPDGPIHLGVTATPDRGDKTGLDKVFDEITFTYDLLWGIRNGYLSDIKGLRIHLANVDFRSVKVRQGDYDAGEVGEMLENADAPELIVEAWLKHASERKTLVFTPTVATATLTAEAFQNAGVPAEIISANTPLEERRAMLRRFAKGELRVLCNVAVLTEGFDDPEVSCIVMARLTRSRALFAQIVGRGSRRHPDKKDCLVIDVCGAANDNSLVTIPSLFGVPKKEKEFEEGDKTIGEMIFEEEEKEVKRGKMQARAIDLFKKVLESPINWNHFTSRSGLRTYVCGIMTEDPDDRQKKYRSSVVIEHLNGGDEDDERQWRCYVRWDRKDELPPHIATENVIKSFANGDRYRVLISHVDLEMAQGVGEDYIRKNSVPVLVNRNAAWRQRPATDKQKETLDKMRIAYSATTTVGEASDLIGAKIEKSRHGSRDRKPAPKYISDAWEK
jgi:superfamily II DNA or RNA helicase